MMTGTTCFAADIADDSAHGLLLLVTGLRLAELLAVFQLKPELFDDRVGEHLAGNALDLGVGRGAVQRVGQPQDEVLALPHVLDAAVLHFFEGVVNGLPLRIKHGLLQRDIDVSLHFA